MCKRLARLEGRTVLVSMSFLFKNEMGCETMHCAVGALCKNFFVRVLFGKKKKQDRGVCVNTRRVVSSSS